MKTKASKDGKRKPSWTRPFRGSIGGKHASSRSCNSSTAPTTSNSTIQSSGSIHSISDIIGSDVGSSCIDLNIDEIIYCEEDAAPDAASVGDSSHADDQDGGGLAASRQSSSTQGDGYPSEEAAPLHHLHEVDEHLHEVDEHPHRSTCNGGSGTTQWSIEYLMEQDRNEIRRERGAVMAEIEKIKGRIADLHRERNERAAAKEKGSNSWTKSIFGRSKSAAKKDRFEYQVGIARIQLGALQKELIWLTEQMHALERGLSDHLILQSQQQRWSEGTEL